MARSQDPCSRVAIYRAHHRLHQDRLAAGASHPSANSHRRCGCVSTQPPVLGVNWKAEPAEHNFPAAADYLALILPEKQVKKLVAPLRNGPQVQKKAKDLERASGL